MRFAWLIALTACGSSALPFAPAGPDAAPAPSRAGPYRVGVRTLVIEDATRETPGKTGPRRLVTEVWYPTDDTEGTPASYRVPDILSPEAIAKLGDASLDTAIETRALRDAALRREEAPYPVVFFSHGANAVRMQSTYLVIDLASHGYVVIAPDHDGNTLSDLVLDGALDPAAAAAYFLIRPDDIRALMERLRFEPPEWLAGALDFGRVGVAGHSFGALTSLRLAGLSDKLHPVHALVAQAPPGYGPTWIGIDRPLDAIGAPLMIQGGALDDTTPVSDARSFWDRAATPKHELILDTAGHFTFSDLCGLDPRVVAAVSMTGVGDALSDGCAPSNVAPADAFPVLRHYTIGMFNAYLRASPGSLALLDESAGRALGPAPLAYRRAP